MKKYFFSLIAMVMFLFSKCICFATEITKKTLTEMSEGELKATLETAEKNTGIPYSIFDNVGLICAYAVVLGIIPLILSFIFFRKYTAKIFGEEFL